MIDLFNNVWGALLLGIGLWVAGWYSHAWYHRHDHDNLKKKIEEQAELLKDGLKVKITNYTEHSVEKIELPDEETDMLIWVNERGSPGAMEGMPSNRIQLVVNRLIDKDLMDDDYDVTELGLEWLDKNGHI